MQEEFRDLINDSNLSNISIIGRSPAPKKTVADAAKKKVADKPTTPGTRKSLRSLRSQVSIKSLSSKISRKNKVGTTFFRWQNYLAPLVMNLYSSLGITILGIFFIYLRKYLNNKSLPAAVLHVVGTASPLFLVSFNAIMMLGSWVVNTYNVSFIVIIVSPTLNTNVGSETTHLRIILSASLRFLEV